MRPRKCERGGCFKLAISYAVRPEGFGHRFAWGCLGRKRPSACRGDEKFAAHRAFPLYFDDGDGVFELSKDAPALDRVGGEPAMTIFTVSRRAGEPGIIHP